MKQFLGIVCACFLSFSCMTFQEPVDRGVIDLNNTSESELATLTIDQYINIVSINGKEVRWRNPSQSIREQFVKLSPGVHTFSVTYNDGDQYSILPITVIGDIEKGKSYTIKGVVIGNRLAVIIIDSVTKADASLNKKLQGDDSSVFTAYIKYILTPTMQENNKTIKLENDDTIIIYKPDMTYTQQDKKTKIIVSGYRGFTADLSTKTGKVYLLETDVTKMSKDEFLDKSEYRDKAQIIMMPIKCSETSVTYKYLKPENMKDQEVEFSISQM